MDALNDNYVIVDGKKFYIKPITFAISVALKQKIIGKIALLIDSEDDVETAYEQYIKNGMIYELFGSQDWYELFYAVLSTKEQPFTNDDYAELSYEEGEKLKKKLLKTTLSASTLKESLNMYARLMNQQLKTITRLQEQEKQGSTS